MHKLVLIRHGESLWNKANLFTGWMDVNLSDKGIQEALHAGRLLKEEQFVLRKASRKRLFGLGIIGIRKLHRRSNRVKMSLSPHMAIVYGH